MDAEVTVAWQYTRHLVDTIKTTAGAVGQGVQTQVRIDSDFQGQF